MEKKLLKEVNDIIFALDTLTAEEMHSVWELIKSYGKAEEEF